MSETATLPDPTQDVYQLTQVVVPLDQARHAFTHADAEGRVPLVVIPTRPFRLVNPLTVAAVAIPSFVFLLVLITLSTWYLVPALALGIVLLVAGIVRAFLVSVPEGTSALLARGGKYRGALDGGSHVVMPWVAVTHLVSQREVPFDVLIVDAPTRDTVRVRVETLLTFSIVHPRDFVFNISTGDFDQVLQASCQEALRSVVRHVTVAELFDLASLQIDGARDTIDGDVQPYGVEVKKIKIVYAEAPVDFMRTQEGQQLAVLQRAEQAEKQALAELIQTDNDTLERHRLHGRFERDRDEMRVGEERAEARRRLFELEAESEALRLAKLEQRLQDSPLAAHWDAESARLKVASELAGNSRAVLQIGSVDDISRVLLMQQIRLDDQQSDTAPGAGNSNGASAELSDGRGTSGHDSDA